MDSLGQHPPEDGEEEEMEEAGDGRAGIGNRVRIIADGVQAAQEQDLCQEQVDAQVQMDCCSIASQS